MNTPLVPGLLPHQYYAKLQGTLKTLTIGNTTTAIKQPKSDKIIPEGAINVVFDYTGLKKM